MTLGDIYRWSVNGRTGAVRARRRGSCATGRDAVARVDEHPRERADQRTSRADQERGIPRTVAGQIGHDRYADDPTQAAAVIRLLTPSDTA